MIWDLVRDAVMCNVVDLMRDVVVWDLVQWDLVPQCSDMGLDALYGTWCDM